MEIYIIRFATSEYQNFSDFAEERGPLEGDKVKIADILNKKILITGHDIKESRYQKNKSGKYLTIQFQREESEDPKVVFTGSDVLIDQLEKYAQEIPFWTTIKKINRYFTLS